MATNSWPAQRMVEAVLIAGISATGSSYGTMKVLETKLESLEGLITRLELRAAEHRQRPWHEKAGVTLAEIRTQLKQIQAGQGH